MWPWVLIAAVCLLLLLVMGLLYRRAALAAAQPPSREAMPPIEEVAALLQELEDAGEAIIARMESKKNEIDALLRLVDAKLDSLQSALQTQAPTPSSASATCPATSRAQTNGEVGGRHQQVRALSAAGLDPVAIAQRTGMRLDEVRLIINLQASQDRS